MWPLDRLIGPESSAGYHKQPCARAMPSLHVIGSTYPETVHGRDPFPDRHRLDLFVARDLSSFDHFPCSVPSVVSQSPLLGI